MQGKTLHPIDACVFDAYGTLFDFNSAAAIARDELGEDWQRLSQLWRDKQLQYTWLRGLADHYADFWQVTGDALEFALATLRLHRPGLHSRLMKLYLRLDTFPEVPDTLRRLKEAGLKLAILSNGSHPMLSAVVRHNGLDDVFDAVLSVDAVKVFKPHPSVYRLAQTRLAIEPERICFLSANAWDAYSAKAFGFRVLWCNRYGQVPERIPARPDGEIPDLAALPDCLRPTPPRATGRAGA